MELVACTGKSTQRNAFKAVMNRQMGEAHLDAFSLVARLGETFVLISRGHIAGILMDVARDLSRVSVAPSWVRIYFVFPCRIWIEERRTPPLWPP